MFSEIYKKNNVVKKRLLKSDWSKEESEWDKNLSIFLESIKDANTIVKKDNVSIIKENSIVLKNEHTDTVSTIIEPTISKEVIVDNKEFDFLDFNDTTKEDVDISKAHTDDVKTSSNAKNEHIDLLKEEQEQLFNEKNNSVNNSIVSDTIKDDKLIEGFNVELFQLKIKSIADEILKNTPKIELEEMSSQLPEFTVKLNLDEYRENPDIIADYLIEVQSKKDALSSHLIKLSALHTSIDQAMDFVVNMGVSCSSASNKERRVAQVHYMIKDLFILYVNVQQVLDSYERTNKHLYGQTETLSRLLTAQIERSRVSFLSKPKTNSDNDYTSNTNKDRYNERSEQNVMDQNIHNKNTQTRVGNSPENLEQFNPHANFSSKPDKFKKGEIDF